MTVPNDLSLGIDTIKKLIRDSSIKALSGKRLIVLNNFNTATIEAQNALLKFLEDSKNQIILISAKNLENILPTVISRCEIIKDKNVKNEADKKIQQTLENLLFASSSKRLSFAQKIITSKDEALEFINKLINNLEIWLLSDPDGHNLKLEKLEIVSLLKKSQNAKQFIEDNVNFKHVIDVLLLGFPKLYAKV